MILQGVATRFGSHDSPRAVTRGVFVCSLLTFKMAEVKSLSKLLKQSRSVGLLLYVRKVTTGLLRISSVSEKYYRNGYSNKNNSEKRSSVNLTK